MQSSNRDSEILKRTYDTPLQKQLMDFPKTEIWRLQTDGWQHVYGPKNFRNEYYMGIQDGFKFIEQHLNEKINTDLAMGLYIAAAQFEKFYEILQKYDAWGGEFNIILTAPDSEIYPIAGVSEKGLVEFASALREGYMNQTIQLTILPSDNLKLKYKNFCNELGIEEEINLLQPTYFKNDEDLVNHLRFYLSAAGKDDELRAASKKDSSIVFDVSNVTQCRLQGQYDREKALEVLNKKLNEFYIKITPLQQYEGADKNEKIMKLITKLVQSLHQKHIFNDGNGRTFVTLLVRWLLLQNNLSLCFINTPSHFAGFSTEQLTAELQEGINQFQEYCVTKAKEVLANLSLENIDKTEQIKESLLKNISQNPLIALAQINELFVQIQTNKFKVPPNYSDSNKR